MANLTSFLHLMGFNFNSKKQKNIKLITLNTGISTVIIPTTDKIKRIEVFQEKIISKDDTETRTVKFSPFISETILNG